MAVPTREREMEGHLIRPSSRSTAEQPFHLRAAPSHQFLHLAERLLLRLRQAKEDEKETKKCHAGEEQRPVCGHTLHDRIESEIDDRTAQKETEGREGHRRRLGAHREELAHQNPKDSCPRDGEEGDEYEQRSERKAARCADRYRFRYHQRNGEQNHADGHARRTPEQQPAPARPVDEESRRDDSDHFARRDRSRPPRLARVALDAHERHDGRAIIDDGGRCDELVRDGEHDDHEEGEFLVALDHRPDIDEYVQKGRVRKNTGTPGPQGA